MAKTLYRFHVVQRNEQGRRAGRSFHVRAPSVEDAARRAAEVLFGRKRGLFANRETGSPGGSGVFCAFHPVRAGGSTNVGCFHVGKLPMTWR